ncbi:MAG: SO_0444 family Cu/Zn efflux transporter [Candidatus Zixiibacteriota bacterium]
MTFIAEWAESTWCMVLCSAFLFVLGLILAGLLHLVLNEKILHKLNSGSRWSRVFKTAVIGIPLPLCSCSVLPVASRLRAGGVSKGGVAAFLVATPETGIDSLLLTYALTDPMMTIARPVAGWITAMTVGMTEEALGAHQISSNGPRWATLPQSDAGCGDDCCCAPEKTVPQASFVRRIPFGITYAFTDLLADLAPYLLIGFVLAGLATVVIGTGSIVPASVGTGWQGYLWGALIGIPLYVCATSSTPLAASLLAAGFSPGAILVFLLVGPATNIASMVVLKKLLGLWSAMRFVVLVIATSIVCGVVLDMVYHALRLPVSFRAASVHLEHLHWYDTVCAIGLSALILLYSARAGISRLRARL